MLIKYIYLFLIIVILVVFSVKDKKVEKFKDDNKHVDKKLITIEMLDNQEVTGGFVNSSGDAVGFKLGEKIKFEFNYLDVNKGFTMTIDNKSIYTPLVLQKDIEYEYMLLVFPIENLIFILVKSKKDKDYKLVFTLNNNIISNKTANDLIYTNVSKSIKYSPVSSKITTLVLKSGLHELYRIMDKNKKSYLNVVGSKLELLNVSDVGDKKSVLWSIEKHGSYFTIKSATKNLFLSMKGDSLSLDNKKDNSIRYYVINNKENYIISHQGRVLKLENLEQNDLLGKIVLEKVDNVGQWLTYGSAINIINNENLYMSGDLNKKYEKTSLFSVYCDEKAEKSLIQWLIEDYLGNRSGYYVKEGDEVYLKNNGMYLQIIKGNYSINFSGLEVSLGAEKNDNSKWIISKRQGTDRLFRRGLEVYLYHPKMEVYLYNTGKKFMLVGSEKIEVVGRDRKNNRAVWKMDTVSLDKNKLSGLGKVDFYKYTSDNNYFKKKEEEWKQILMKENNEIKSQISHYNNLEKREKQIIQSINKTNDSIKKILGEKCPATKICINPIDVSCIPVKKKGKVDKKEKEGLYNVVYVKDKDTKSNPYYIHSNKIKKCETLNDFNINESPMVKTKKYLPRKGAKLKITDFNITEFPEGKDLVSIESLPQDKKITDFKINELIGYENLKLKGKK